MIGSRHPIEFWPVTVSATTSGGETEVYNSANKIADFAEISDLGDSKINGQSGVSQQTGKKFRVDYRPSLEAALNQSTRIKWDGIFYNILTIRTQRNRKYEYVIEARVQV